MTPAQVASIGILLLTLLGQAVYPRLRMVIVSGGAAATALLTPLLTDTSSRELLAAVPWDVVVIVLALGLLSELLASSRVFPLLAMAVARVSGGSPVRISILFTVGMYVVSGLVNNLTALLLVLPVLLGMLELLGVTRRYVRWTLGPMLVACNLGGAATPIGDFPAILLLGSGAMEFGDYLVRALPQTLAALALLVGFVALLARPGRGVDRSALGARLALRTMGELHRNITIDWRVLAPGGLCLGGMLAAWTLVPASLGVGPEVVAWVGTAVALATTPRAGEILLRRRVDAEAGLFLVCLFVLVGAVRASGALDAAGDALLALPLSPAAQLALFLVVAALLTGVFSAGPSMAALLDVAAALAERLPPHTVYVGLALSVCAGSSLALTAATAGPLAQALTDRAGLREPDGSPIRFDFGDFLPVGLVGFTLTLAVGLGTALASLR